MTANRTPVARFAGNATPLAIAHLGSNGLLLVNAVLLARILGVESYGLLAIGMAMYGLTAFLSDAGLGMWGMRVIDDDPDRWATVIRLTVARLATASLALVFAFGLVLVLPLPAGARAPSLVMVVTMVPAGFAVEWALIGLERTGRAAAARLVVGVAMLALSPALALAAGPVGAAAGYVVAAALGSVVSWSLLLRTIGRPHWARPQGIVRTLRRSLPMGASAVLGQVYWQSDSLLTGILLGSVAAGLYAAPMRLLAAVVGLGWVVGTSLLPVYRALDATEPVGVSRLATLTTRLLVLACLPAVGVAMGGAPTIVATILGADFARSAPVLAIGSLTVAGWLCMVPTGYAILARRQDRRYLAATAAAVVTSIPLIAMLSGAWGIIGVALAMLVAEAAAAMILAVGATRMGVRLQMVPIIAAVVVAVAVAALAGLAAAAQSWGIAGIVGVGLLAETPFFAIVMREVRGARSRVLRGDAVVVAETLRASEPASPPK